MRVLSALFLAWLVAIPATAAEVDLSKIDRQIPKEPAYKAKPRYALLVFGKEATTRVWFVVDGGAVYLDRNGNGDLTEPGEQIDLKTPKPAEAGSTAKTGLGEIRGPGDKAYRILGIQHLGAAYTQIVEQQKEALKNLKGQTKEQAKLVEEQVKQLEEQFKAMQHYYMVTIALPGGVQQYTAMTLAESAKDAPVFHFGGPLKMWTSPSVTLKRGDKSSEISTAVITPGFSKAKSEIGGEAMVLVNCCTEGSVSKDIHPVVEIEFANAEPGGKPIVAKYELKERC